MNGLEQLECRRLLAGDLVEQEKLLSQKHPAPAAIIGGTESQRGRYPWIVSLQDRRGHFCGGTLISPDAIVTAAHCVEGAATATLTAVIGREDLNRGDGKRVGVSQIIIHPDYDADTNDSDIAVVLLADVVAQDPLEFLRAEDAEAVAAGTLARVLGWGTTREGGRTSSLLREVQVPIVSNASANERPSYNGAVTANMLAAGLPEGGSDSCQGDSGGPLTVAIASAEPRLAGIVSWGEGCARANKFGIYTRVDVFADWLESLSATDASGDVDFSQGRYVDGEQAAVILQDADLVNERTAQVVVQADTGDEETITLRSFSPGRFRGQIAIVAQPAQPGDGVLNVAGADSILVEYQDRDDGSGLPAIARAAARIIVDDFANSATGAAPLMLAQTVTGDIEVSTDTDWFSFVGEVDRAYDVTVSLTGSLNDSLVTIYDADGTTVLGFDDDSGRGLGSHLLFGPLENDTYFVSVTGYGGNVGTYQLQVTSVDPPADDHANVLGTGTRLAVPARARGRLDLSSDTDWFQFSAKQGTLYQLDVELGSLTDSRMRLIDSDGRSELAFNDDADLFTLASRIYYRAETTGVKYFEVAGYQGAIGSYVVHVVQSDDDHSNSAAGATEVDTLASSSVVGAISPQDVDWFSFAARENAFYEIQTRLTSLTDSVVTLYDVDGVRALAANDDQEDSLASRVVWQAPRDGKYFVEVAAFENQAGSYRLEVRQLHPDPRDDFGNRATLANSLDVPNARLGRIDYETDRDWFRFHAFAGVRYTFEVQLRSLDDSVLQIFAADGLTLLAENDDLAFPDRSSRIEWAATDTGPTFVVVSAYDGFVGSYRLATSLASRPGDFNLDGVLDAADIDLLFAEMREGSDEPDFDLNGDAEVDSRDSEVLIQDILGTRVGDANLDGSVGFDDFLQLSRSFLGVGGWSDGDFDGTGRIDFEDFLLLANQFGL